jgi:WbqC-like protein family
VIQPYFLPCNGYFRLFATADCIAFSGCAQFPRRGWVHRNRLPDTLGRPAWLPLQRAPMSARIMDLRFAADAGDRLVSAVRALGADSFVNLEGDRDLYEASAFEAQDLRLRILPAWRGSRWSILHRLMTEPADAVAREIHEQT